jgi:hypothetical protein
MWILYRHLKPTEALKQGFNAVVCLDCQFQGDETGVGRICYVNLGHGPRNVYEGYRRGIYPRLKQSQYKRVFRGREIRFGAYGEPVLIPITIVRALVACTVAHTGYTHQWAKPQYQEYREYIMASCDSPADFADARAMGWRTFRARTENQPMLPGEIMCLASPEFRAAHPDKPKLQCIDCTLCDGARHGATDPRANIAIVVHGSGSKNFVSLDSITTAAAAA